MTAPSLSQIRVFVSTVGSRMTAAILPGAGVVSIMACRCRSVNVKAIAGAAAMLLAREWCCRRVAGSWWLLLRGMDEKRCS